MPTVPPLERRLGTVDATAIGLGSMLGAGAFAVFGPSAALAGPWLLLSLGLAGAVAYANAVASAALASKYPSSGGTYVYGRKQLGEWPGFLAGWGFVTGKAASCAAMALTFGVYVAPSYAAPLAVGAVVALTGVNLAGITRTALVTKVLLGVVLAVLAFAIVVGIAGPPRGSSAAAVTALSGDGAGSPLGVLTAAGVLFFAFAGYARIATLGEEVRDPTRAIPRAILAALAGALAIYAVLAVVLTLRIPGLLPGAAAPIRELAAPAGPWAEDIVRAGASAACLGALLALIAGVGRTSLAMAREGDLPRALARIGGPHSVPWAAELAVCAVVVALVLSGSLLTVVGFSSFGVLVYYAVANASAFTLRERPVYCPRWLNAAGTTGCLVLAFTLPWASAVTMIVVLAAGTAVRAVVLTTRRRRAG
ncbi:amino acid permease [Sinomonas sp. ASV486]|uniref:APC family permease n=1 Tax=Sinomonas sp. ASV486 TaxID=3051170 RepID=UPI0027DE181C|nr:amino acid permease [Sinomonas sp. ASV486]MDQ4491486.1 amino acid permease [Sinomonas sp. ASV486]